MNDYAGVRYDARACRGHVESYFLKANDPTGSRAVWLKATIFASVHDPTHAVAEAWAIAFDRDAGHVAVKSWVPYEDARFSHVDLAVSVDGCSFARDASRGMVATGERAIRWDLTWKNESAPLPYFPAAWMYEGGFPEHKPVTLAPDARFTGHVDIGGRRWTLDGWPGMLGHNWGRRHNPRYAWGHCNVWEQKGEDAEVVFEGGSGQAPIGPVLSPVTTWLFVTHRGVRYRLNGALDVVRSRAHISPRRWTFHGKNDVAKVEGELWADTDDFVGLFYPNPDGAMTYCLNTKIAHAELRFQPRGRSPIELTSRAAALEIGTRDPNHGIKMYV